MRAKKDKGPLRNFYLLKKADDELVRQSTVTGRDMTKVIEDLLLNRCQSSPAIELFAAAEAKTISVPGQQTINTAFLGLPARVAVDEAGALAMLSLDKRQPAAAKKAFWRFRRMHNVKTLPGGVYSVRAIERASA
jgi:hypothetical protein